MQITDANLQLMFNTFSLAFQGAYMKPPALFYDKFATVVPSSTTLQTYAWVGKLPTMRQWVGERFLANLKSYSYQLTNLDYELTDELDRNTILDDQYGLFSSVNIPMLANAAAKQPDYLIRDLLRAGQTTPTFDGANFFDTVHPVDKFPGSQGASLAVQQNYWAAGKPLTLENFASVQQSMMGFLGEDGQPLGINPNLLVVPPQLAQVGRMICQAQMVAPNVIGAQTNVGSMSNIYNSTLDGGPIQLLVVPELTGDPNVWYLMDTSKAIKPFIFQLRQPPVFSALTRPEDPNVFFRKKFVYGVDMRCAAGISLWFLAAKASALWPSRGNGFVSRAAVFSPTKSARQALRAGSAGSSIPTATSSSATR